MDIEMGGEEKGAEQDQEGRNFSMAFSLRFEGNQFGKEGSRYLALDLEPSDLSSHTKLVADLSTRARV